MDNGDITVICLDCPADPHLDTETQKRAVSFPHFLDDSALTFSFDGKRPVGNFPRSDMDVNEAIRVSTIRVCTHR